MALTFSVKKKGAIDDVTTQLYDMGIDYMDVLPQLESLTFKQADALRELLTRIENKSRK